MFKRAIWFGTGVASGAAGSVWVKRKVRQKVDRYTPEQLARRAESTARRLRSDVKVAIGEGREVMRSYRDNARAELEAQRRRDGFRSVSGG